MDRELSAATKQAHKRKRFWQIGVAIALVAAAIFGFRTLITPSIGRSEIRTATVEHGPVVATLTASGVVVPEHEQAITSPIQARIEQVVRTSGEEVEPGDQVLLLDRSFSQLTYDKLKDEQEMNQHKRVQLRLQLQKKLNALESQLAIKRMSVKSLQARLEDEQYLLKIGGGTQEQVKQAELNLRISQQELAQLERDIASERELLKADEQELGFTLAMQGRTIEELERKMQQAEVRATHRGVVTWVKNEIGSNVNAGDVIVRLADLSSFKIKAAVSDAFAEQLQTGGEATIRVNDTDLNGTIAAIEPTVTNGTVTFFVALHENAHKVLRPNLRVDVYVTTATKPNTLRVKNGPYFNSAHNNDRLFVVRGDELVQIPASTGASNTDFVEVEGSVQPGDEVVISSLEDYEHLKKIKLD
ncbi:HlyD family efflux transporter periplasmic adaptor subunit [Pontibacter diazotrophicus]|uniref:HlyD family efflux transporter periplasmic adaptor subunit n=1 Tax=Pontibacter diazotrophicus TaxID=1400979 RepID=A0A3D8L8E8_9BACT|nr:HlyD family efflux transporter periplasmic adaptor subunit [Pontibacter diazotrophicus]RDV13675.1 HlyD family efflux transporter periplasmic adaptor subunit [Pontibacter diazotrophicus]